MTVSVKHKGRDQKNSTLMFRYALHAMEPKLKEQIENSIVSTEMYIKS